MAKKPETKFKENVLKRVRAIKGVWAVKIQLRSIRGIPDILGFAGIYGFAWELKVDAEIEPLQKYTLRDIRATGAFVDTITPQNLEESLLKLEKLAKKGLRRRK